MGDLCAIEGCHKPTFCRGMCGTHYRRWRAYGDPRIGKGALHGEPMAFLLQAAFTDSNECILWPYASKPNGYGSIRVGGSVKFAHRVALSLRTGVDPEGLEAAHGPCHNRLCVNANPAHGLAWKTRKENAADMHRDKSFKPVRAKLCVSDVHEIRASAMPHKELAVLYGVHVATIRAIRRGAYWGRV